MLYIIASNSHDLTREHEFGWHVGEKFNDITKTQMNHVMKNITQVQADGDELQAILAKSKNLPHTSDRVQNWHGDHAKWIVSNIVMKG